jgi:molybdenum cofactor cytidylyltransferase
MGAAGVLILDAIVLAAGAGARFGGRKLTAPWRDGVLLDGALAAALAAGVEGVIVVHGADPAVAEAARGFFAGRRALDRLRLVHARDHELGLSASLRAGVEAVADDRDGAILFLGDMPIIPPGLSSILIAALDQGALAAAPTWRGLPGHPVVVRRSLFPALMACAGDRGAREVLRTLGDRFILVPTDDAGIVIDIDETGDLKKLL